MKEKNKIVIYQVFTRLFGNTNTTNKPWGTIAENGVGKFAHFTEKALQEIKALGVTHIWYTGVPHHDLVGDYTAYGIGNDDPEVVKGRAGSPYAVKDYYNVDPDLATDPAKRMEEFKELVQRTHDQGLKLLLDIVPNHVARNYQGASTPQGKRPFGADDDTSVTYARNNDFYYNPGEAFQLPDWRDGYLPLGGEPHPLIDGHFEENPAKWTGNGSRASKPDMNDWYETVKVNYGIRPDGSKDFDELPPDFWNKGYEDHYHFWESRSVPGSWIKFKDIALFWLDVGVDGFRYDMAEMVPVEFWSYMNSNIKMKNPEALLLAEVYNPSLYRTYIHLGKMDYLYDKVEFYDSLKHIMKGYGWTDHMPYVQDGMMDIEHHMLHFLENHDEHRLASPDFVGNAQLGKPAMVVSATISTSPTMLYFGQEVGEPGAEKAGFGQPGRTSIFDYIGVPHHQRWMNDLAFDGGQLSDGEQELRDFYKRLLNVVIQSPALMGNYKEIHRFNRERNEAYNYRVLSFLRWNDAEKLLIISNFDVDVSHAFTLSFPQDVVSQWGLAPGSYTMEDLLYGEEKVALLVDGEAQVAISLKPLQSFIFALRP